MLVTISYILLLIILLIYSIKTRKELLNPSKITPKKMRDSYEPHFRKLEKFKLALSTSIFMILVLPIILIAPNLFYLFLKTPLVLFYLFMSFYIFYDVKLDYLNTLEQNAITPEKGAYPYSSKESIKLKVFVTKLGMVLSGIIVFIDLLLYCLK